MTDQTGPAVQGQAGSQVRSFLLGAVLGVDAIGHCIALATLAFAGPLAFALGYGSMLILLSSALLALILAWRSVFPPAAGLAEDTAIAILAPAMVLAATQVSGPPQAMLATAVAIMGLSTLLSGLAIYSIGRFHLGRVARIMPFPVAAGFLAASGWLLVSNALLLLTGASGLGTMVTGLATGGLPLNLLLGLVLVLAIWLTGQVLSGALSALVPILGAVALFYLALPLAGLSIPSARDLGLLPALSVTDLPPLPDLGLLAHVDWPVVAAATVTILAVVLLNAVGFVLNTGGIELALGSDVSIDDEARVSGATNIAIGAFGGLAGFAASDSTILAHRLGCSSRVFGLGLGLVTLVGCAFAGPITAHVPVFVAAGLLLYFGVVMLDDWLLGTFRRLRLQDWAVIPIILATAMLADILVAIAMGIFVALLIFVYNYALHPVVRFEGSGRGRRSSVDRAPEEERALAVSGEAIHVLTLQGYLFFGSVERIIDALRRRLGTEPPLRRLIVDFSHVAGLDSAACAAFLKLGKLAQTGGFTLSLSAVSPDQRAVMERWGIQEGLPPVFSYWPDLDSALEDAEEALIAEALAGGPQPSVPLARHLSALLPRAADLVARMERMELAPGDVLIRAGSVEGDIFFLESGRVDVRLPATVGPPTRLRSLRAGAVVGEAARYLNRTRTADVVVHDPSVVYRLSEAAIRALEAEDSELAAQFHAWMASSLAEKVERTNGLLTAALR